MSEVKTHYRKAFNSPYLSSADIVEPTVLTIKHVKLEADKTKRTQDHFNTAYFVEKELRPGQELKPMILKVHNSNVVKTLAGSVYIGDWNDIAVTIYVDHNVRFGRDTVDGLRIRPESPRQKGTLQRGTKQWESAVAAYKRDGNLDAVTSRVNVSDEDAELIKQEASEVS